MANITKTYPIDIDMQERFKKLCSKKKLNKSKIIQDCIEFAKVYFI